MKKKGNKSIHKNKKHNSVKRVRRKEIKTITFMVLRLNKNKKHNSVKSEKNFYS